MKNLNKWLLAFACAVLCCTVTACGDDDDNNDNGGSTNPPAATTKQFQYLVYTSTDMVAAADVEVTYTDLATGKEVKRVLTAADNSFDKTTDYWGKLWVATDSPVLPRNFAKIFRFATPACAVANGTAYKISAVIKENKEKMENYKKNNDKFYFFDIRLSAYLDNAPAQTSMSSTHSTFDDLDNLEKYLQQALYDQPETLSDTASW